MKSEFPTTIVVDEPIDPNSGVFLVDAERDISEASIAYVYSQEPLYPRCSNCKHLQDEEHLLYWYCKNADTKHYLMDGLHQPILKPDEWSCPLHQFKAEG